MHNVMDPSTGAVHALVEIAGLFWASRTAGKPVHRYYRSPHDIQLLHHELAERSRVDANPAPRAGGLMSDSARFALHRPELLNALVDGEDKIAILMKEGSITITARATLVDANKDHPFVYRLLKGWAGRTRLLPDGRNQLILIFLPGDLIAVKSMFLTQQIDGIVAISKLSVKRIGRRKLHNAYVADSDIAMRCIWQVIEEERRLHSWVVGLGQGSAEERVARLLLDFRGRLILSETIATDSVTYDMPLTQVQLADHLGITAVHVSRVLKEFRDNGMVTVRDGRVTIMNLDMLAERAAALLDGYERVSPAYVG